jgi:23S rRNA (guanine2445-N2)-methyltransferase / 23S rRNA (guanine2069-N7)-methyltransferase
MPTDPQTIAPPPVTPHRAPATFNYVATCTMGAEGVLADELRALPGVLGMSEKRGAVGFTGTMEAGYRACLWSRTASRLLIELGTFRGDSADAVYEGVHSIDWTAHIGPRSTLAVDFVGTSDGIRNSHFGAMRTKDAIVDRIREMTGERPSVDLEQPDLRVHVHLRSNQFSVSVDLAGEPLNRRGYRRTAGPAPIKESLAATILLLADWPEAARMGAPLVDPMCGSGTFLLEAAGMALDRAPGLGRLRWGFDGWLQHDPSAWARVHAEAEERKAAAATREIGVFGSDIDPEVVRGAKLNADRADLPIRFKRGAIADSHPPASQRADLPRGLLVTNPPYGERLGSRGGAERLGRALGTTLLLHYRGWRALVIAGSPELAGGLGLEPTRSKQLYNGPIDCRLLQYDIPAGR